MDATAEVAAIPSWSNASVGAVRAALAKQDYIADDHCATVAFLAEKMGKPVLVEGPAGTGKTAMAKAVAAASQRPLIRLQCYEGLDETRALFEWNYRKQLLRLQERAVLDETRERDNLFTEEFLLARPLLEAIRSPVPAVLLIDEVDRLDVETEALLLEILAERQVSIPELGTIRATCVPAIYLTSNSTRRLSEALQRRCLYLHLGYPSVARERAILQRHVPDLEEHLAERIAVTINALRGLDLNKPPSISETVDWARTLLLMGIDESNGAALHQTSHVLVKTQRDLELVIQEIDKGSLA